MEADAPDEAPEGSEAGAGANSATAAEARNAQGGRLAQIPPLHFLFYLILVANRRVARNQLRQKTC